MFEGLLGLLSGGGNLLDKIPVGALGMAAGKNVSDLPAGLLGGALGKDIGDIPAGLLGGALGASMGDIPAGALGLINANPEMAAGMLGAASGMAPGATAPNNPVLAAAPNVPDLGGAPVPVGPMGMPGGVPVEDLTAPLDRSLGTTQTQMPMTQKEMMDLQKAMMALQSKDKAQAPAVPTGNMVSRGTMPQARAAAPAVAPTQPGAYSQMLSRMVSGMYG